MKRSQAFVFALVWMALLSPWQLLFAQCTSNPADSTLGFRPLQLPQGCTGQPYSADFHFALVTDTVVFGIHFVFDSVELQSVIGLPSGLSITYDSPNNWYKPATPGARVVGCGRVSGVAADGNHPGDSIWIVTRHRFTGPFKNKNAFDTVGIQLYIQKAPSAGFSASHSGLDVAFTNTSPSYPTWHWTFGDGDTSMAWSPTHAYAAPGTYQACLHMGDADCGTTVCATMALGGVGIPGSEAERLLLYPNPARDRVRIDFERLRHAGEWRVMNAVGQTLRIQSVAAGATSAELSVDGLPEGFYLVELRSKDTCLRGRLEVTR